MKSRSSRFGSWRASPAGQGKGGDAGCRPEACCENRDHVGGSLPVALAPRRLAMARFTPGILARPRGHEAGGPWDRAGSQWRAVSLPREMPRTPARHNPQVGIDGPAGPGSGSARGIGPVPGQCRFLRVISEHGHRQHRRARCGNHDHGGFSPAGGQKSYRIMKWSAARGRARGPPRRAGRLAGQTGHQEPAATR